MLLVIVINLAIIERVNLFKESITLFPHSSGGDRNVPFNGIFLVVLNTIRFMQNPTMLACVQLFHAIRFIHLYAVPLMVRLVINFISIKADSI